MINRNILLNPGPATISMRVKMAQVVPDICPRERQFGALMHKISDNLLKMVKNHQDAACVLFCGSGTLGVEAAINSSIGDHHKLAIIVNGAYGERIKDIANCYHLNIAIYESSFLEPIDFAQLELFLLKEKPDFLAVVHSETTSGLLNDLEKISEIAKKTNTKLIVDCMSSFACYQLDLNLVDFIIASSNKNLQGVAGVSFVIAKNKDILMAKYARSLYLDLKSQYEYFVQNNQMRFTPPVQVLYALNEAILELQEEGLENRFLRYQISNKVLREGLSRLGFEVFPKTSASVIITSVLMPKDLDFEEMHNYCLDRGFTIYPGKISGKNMFRVSNIGMIDSLDIRLFLEVLEDFLKNKA